MISSAMSWADGPLAAFDVESTGVDTDTDRIVTATLVAITPGQQPVVRTWLADPGMEIPASATEVHGISTEYARTHGRAAGTVVTELVEALAEVWTATTPLCAFNASFDLSLLAAELHRHHQQELTISGPVVDPLCLDKYLDRYRKGKRTLAALCEHHRVRLEDAHSSAGDALACARLAWRLAKSYPEQVGALEPAVLHEQQTGWYRTQQHSFADYLDHLAGRQQDAHEAEQLRRRATDVRDSAEHWPLRPVRSGSEAA
ncbi:exonuclease domain-containing protein [Haloactinomyces albus]|uniref:DNA polymerase-3 subunit epsilon n=1 Tax=Haloactinomyces albus TaxID=1352928 RepID=A0AAE3ZFR3_9ACTN|nr:exonuclease domain-containing protein [Haloactinomyces albus]MDR7302783.1 DNA polymerase-3 subunit epsilon [Haloactinomyces albus]